MTCNNLHATYAWFDLKDYTQFMTQHSDEEVLLELVKYYNLVKSLAKKYSGQIIASLGDGLGVLFTGTQTQTKALMMSKETLTKINQAKGFKVKVRVGLETGPITHLEIPTQSFDFINSLYTGSTIVKAFRIGSLAGENGYNLLISEAVYNHLDDKLKMEFDDFYEVQLKGFKDKEKIFPIKHQK